jgi:hypothetical protein
VSVAIDLSDVPDHYFAAPCDSGTFDHRVTVVFDLVTSELRFETTSAETQRLAQSLEWEECVRRVVDRYLFGKINQRVLRDIAARLTSELSRTFSCKVLVSHLVSHRVAL